MTRKMLLGLAGVTAALGLGVATANAVPAPMAYSTIRISRSGGIDYTEGGFNHVRHNGNKGTIGNNGNTVGCATYSQNKATCFVKNSSTYKSCSTTDPRQIGMIQRLGRTSSLSVSMDNGTCLAIAVANYSVSLEY